VSWCVVWDRILPVQTSSLSPYRQPSTSNAIPSLIASSPLPAIFLSLSLLLISFSLIEREREEVDGDGDGGKGLVPVIGGGSSVMSSSSSSSSSLLFPKRGALDREEKNEEKGRVEAWEGLQV